MFLCSLFTFLVGPNAVLLGSPQAAGDGEPQPPAAEQQPAEQPAAEQPAEAPAASESADAGEAQSASTWPSAWVTSIAPIGQEVFAATAEGLLLRPAKVVKFDRDAPNAAEAIYEHPASVWAVVATDTVVCSADYKGNLAVWQRESSQLAMHEGVLQRWCRALVIAPDGQHLVAGNESGNLFVWSMAQGMVTTSKQLEAQQIFDMAFAPNGESLAICNGAGQIQIVSWPALEPQQTIKLGEQPVWSVVYTADGSALIAGGADRKLWKLALGAEPQPQELATTSDWITSIETVPGGGGFIVATLDGKLMTVGPGGDSASPSGEVPSGVWGLALPSADQMLAGTRKHAVAVLGRAWTVKFVENPSAEPTASN